jgi:hypothetical protein
MTTLAAAAVLVGGADLASYAATGQPLVLGHSNAAGTTTSLKNLGRGPALSLNSAKSSPPLTVNSSKMVKHFNANKVGGRTAAQLNPSLLTYRLGRSNQTLSSGEHYFKIPSPQGQYAIGVHGIWTGVSGDELSCIVLDKRVLTTMNFALVYALPTATLADTNGNIIEQDAFASLRKHHTLVLGCQVSGSGPDTIVQPITFTFKKITPVVKHGHSTTFPKSAVHGLITR